MKKNHIFSAIILGLASFALVSCLPFDDPVDDLRPSEVMQDDVVLQGEADHIDYTVVPTQQGLDSALLRIDTYLSGTMTGQKGMKGGKEGGYPVEHSYQLMMTLADVYAGYAVIPHYDFAYGSNIISSYQISDSWYKGANGQFSLVKNSFAPFLNHPDVDSIPEMKALLLLLLDFVSVEETDNYGPFPYADYKANKTDNPFTYNKMEDIYNTVKDNIDTIQACFRYFGQKPQWYRDRIQQLLYKNVVISRDQANGIQGFETWRRLANSLKLRMAMHMVKVDPDKARQWAEEAVRDGVIESHENEVGMYPNDYGGSHPLQTISCTWGDERLNASFESLMMSLDHPMTRMLFNRNSDALMNVKTNTVSLEANTKIVGIRSGLHVGQGQSYGSNQYIGFSQPNPNFIGQLPLYIMKWCEVDFLRAEGALRGWNMGGTAQSFYERGIDNSSPFDPQNTALGIGYSNLLQAYKQLAEARPYTYQDPTGNSDDIESVTTIGVAWNEADDPETKLEKIITQKYLAGYPNSYEAWVDVRRTGYPKLFPVLNVEDGDGSLKEGDMVRRMIFPNTDDASLKEIQETGLPALGGPDQQATRLWWDVDAPNF